MRRDSMMLLNALQGLQAPRPPSFGSDSEPQASIYATKAADEGALNAWRNVTGLRENADERGLREDMQQRSLASALERSGQDNLRQLMVAGMRAQGDEADRGMKNSQFDAELQRKAQADRDRIEAYNRRTAQMGQRGVGRGGGAGAKPMDELRQIEATEKMLAKELSDQQKPDSFGSVDSQARAAEKVERAKNIRGRLNDLRRVKVEMMQAHRSGDPGRISNALQAARHLFDARPETTATDAMSGRTPSMEEIDKLDPITKQAVITMIAQQRAQEELGGE